MKKLFAVIIAVMLCVSACTPNQTTSDKTAESEQPAQEQEVISAGQIRPEEPVSLDESPLSDEDTKAVNAMLPIMDSILRSIGIDSDSEYDPSDLTFFWSALYLTGVNWGMSIQPEAEEPTVTEDEQGYVTVAETTMQDYAAAAFGSRDLRSIPELYADYITYDEATETLKLAPSDSGDTLTVIESIVKEGDYVTVNTGLYLGNGERLGGMVFVLQDADNAGQFKYSVKSAVNENELGIYQWKGVDIGSKDSLHAGENADYVDFTVTQSGESSVTVSFDIDGSEVKDEIESLVLSNDSIHIGNTTVGDEYTELYIYGKADSGNNITYVYRIQDGQLKKAAIDGVVTGVHGNGSVSLLTEISMLGKYTASCNLMLATGENGDEFGFVRSGDYSVVYENFSEAWDDAALELSKSGLKLTYGDESTGEGKKGDRFLLMGTDMQSYVDLMTEDGRTAKIEISKGDDADSVWQIDGKPESDWFAELGYTG